MASVVESSKEVRGEYAALSVADGDVGQGSADMQPAAEPVFGDVQTADDDASGDDDGLLEVVAAQVSLSPPLKPCLHCGALAGLRPSSPLDKVSSSVSAPSASLSFSSRGLLYVLGALLLGFALGVAAQQFVSGTLYNRAVPSLESRQLLQVSHTEDAAISPSSSPSSFTSSPSPLFLPLCQPAPPPNCTAAPPCPAPLEPTPCPAAPACPDCPSCPASPPPQASLDASVIPSSPDLCRSPDSYPVSFPREVLEYCQGPYPMTPYKPPTRPLTDLAIALLTVHKYRWSRDEFVLHTWLNPVRAPRAYFACTIERPASALQPCLMVPHTSDEFLSNINKSMLGLRELYLRHPDSAWFHMSGDDDYVNPHYLLKKLEAYDPDLPYFIGGPTWDTKCAHNDRPIWFPSGGPGFVLSRALIKATMARMSDWVQTVWLRGTPGGPRDGGDVAIACFMAEFGYNLTHVRGFRIWTPKENSYERNMAVQHPQYHEEINNCQQRHIAAHTAERMPAAD